MPMVSLPVVPGLGAYPSATEPPRLQSAGDQYGLPKAPRDFSPDKFRRNEPAFLFRSDVIAEIDFARAALIAARDGKPILDRALPVAGSDRALQAHLARLLQTQRTGRAWLYEWTYGEIADAVPGLTRAHLATVRNALWNPLWGPTTAAVTDRLTALTAERQWLRDRAADVTAWQAEIRTYEAWLVDVLATFQRYVEWFTDHLKDKGAKAAEIARVLDIASVVVNFVPVVGQILSLILTAVSAGIQVNAFREQLKGLAAAGGRIYAGQVAANVLEATAVVQTELANLADRLDFEAKIRATEQKILETTSPALAPGDRLDAALPSSPPARASVDARVVLAAAVGLGLVALVGGRRG
jgi:hypothetical protein